MYLSNIGPTAHASRVMFLYWGRRGGVVPLTLQIAREVADNPACTVSISSSNERVNEFIGSGCRLFLIDTFSSNFGALLRSWHMPRLRRMLIERLQADQIQTVVTIMPHVWTPIMAPAIRQAGIGYVTVIHDAHRHQGDATAIVQNWILREIGFADYVICLSRSVTEQLVETRNVPREKLVTLFHPDLTLGEPATPHPPAPDSPLRLLFLGRILPYKGLGLLFDAIALLRARGIPIKLSICGEGDLSPFEERIKIEGVEVINRWLSDEEIGSLLPKFHAVALSHIQASQSGVAAAALGSGVPVIANPVGGIRDQIEDGVTGILSRAPTPSAFADAVVRLAHNPEIYASICSNIREARADRSTKRFLAQLNERVLQNLRP